MPDPPPGQFPIKGPPAVTSLTQNALASPEIWPAFIQLTPLLLNACETPANGLAISSKPVRTPSTGCPPWNVIRLFTAQPWVRIFGPCEEPGMSQVNVAEKLWRVSKSPLPYSAFRFVLSNGNTPRYAVISSNACAQV